MYTHTHTHIYRAIYIYIYSSIYILPCAPKFTISAVTSYRVQTKDSFQDWHPREGKTKIH